MVFAAYIHRMNKFDLILRDIIAEIGRHTWLILL
jgi:hypothetical protein